MQLRLDQHGHDVKNVRLKVWRLVLTSSISPSYVLSELNISCFNLWHWILPRSSSLQTELGTVIARLLVAQVQYVFYFQEKNRVISIHVLILLIDDISSHEAGKNNWHNRRRSYPAYLRSWAQVHLKNGHNAHPTEQLKSKYLRPEN